MADDLKKKLIQYGDKVLFGLFLVVLIAVAALTLLGGKTETDGKSHSAGKFRPPDTSVSDEINRTRTEIVQGGVPDGYITGGFASDPDEIYPRAGEKQCPKCAWIMNASEKRCPNCRYMFEDDDDKDGMPNEWEDRYNKYKSPDRYTPDADADPDGDGFSNLKEYLGGSNPDDPKSMPSPIRLDRTYRQRVNLRFKGHVVKAGGDPDVIDPNFWDVQMNFGNDEEMAILPLGSYYKGYKLVSLEKRMVKIEPGGGIPSRLVPVYILTIQRRGQQAIRLVENRWATTHEVYIDLKVTQSGKVFEGLTSSDTFSASGSTFEVYEIRTPAEEGGPIVVILKGSEGETYTLSEH